MISAIVFNLIQVNAAKKTALQLRNELKNEYQQQIQVVADRVCGSFVESLFKFQPMMSAKIATILGREVNLLYRRHHKRVFVTEGKDTYRISALKQIELADSSVLVWVLEFDITWTWLNDSNVIKRPLEEFSLVAVANREALDNFDYGNLNRDEEKENFFNFSQEENVVRLIIPNPLNPIEPIPLHLVDQVFKIRRVEINSTGSNRNANIERPDLQITPTKDLPVGVYSALSLPASSRWPLERGMQMKLRYAGDICLAATLSRDPRPQYLGCLSYPPSGIIGEKYSMKLVYPERLKLDANDVRIDVMSDQSGCQHLHGPLEHKPTIAKQTVSDWPGRFDPDGHVASISVTTLTDLNRVSIAWRGEVAANTSGRRLPVSVRGLRD